MTSYLHAVAGPFHFLLDVRAAHEIWLEGDGADGRPIIEGESQEWRGRPLELWDTRALFALPARPAEAPRTKIALGFAGGDADTILAVDHLAGLETAAADEFRPLPPLVLAASAWFDAVLARPIEGFQLPRWRTELSL
jgi:hypothetical protein